jgi:signal transduction histidine kinase
LAAAGYSPAQRSALNAITPGAAAALLCKGKKTADFFEQVDYSGRRLAKLNVPPRAIVMSLAEYGRLLEQEIDRLPASDARDFLWIHEQLQFCATLTLNKAYYQVREEESHAFFEMFRVEVEERDLEKLIAGMLEILGRYCRSAEARIYLRDLETSEWRLLAACGLTTPEAETGVPEIWRPALRRPFSRSLREGTRGVIARDWLERYGTVWSVPLLHHVHLAGVMQFAFHGDYHWLPREKELLMAAAERCWQAAEKARLVRDLEDRQRQLRQMAEGMVDVEEAERKRISRELHDQAGQDLLWIRLQLEMLEKEIASGSQDGAEPLRERLAGVRDLTEKTIIEIRRLIAALSPAVLDQLGLAAALRQQAHRFRQFHGTHVTLRIGPLERLPQKYEVILYRIVQECLSNVARHSSCSRLNISLSSADGRIRLTVEDDGVGFDMEKALAKQGSFGLAGIRERVKLLGGQCWIESRMRAGSVSASHNQKGYGTRIRVELTLPPTTGPGGLNQVAGDMRAAGAAPHRNGQHQGRKHGKNTNRAGR